MLFTTNFVMIFIITIMLLAMDFYYLKNNAGRRLVGLRWWNEVHGPSGESHWVFESASSNQNHEGGGGGGAGGAGGGGGGSGKVVNATDKRFFWLALYAQPALWVALAVVAVVKFMFVWLTLVGEFLSLYLSVYTSGRGEERRGEERGGEKRREEERRREKRRGEKMREERGEERAGYVVVLVFMEREREGDREKKKE
jgi:hypothetical protein